MTKVYKYTGNKPPLHRYCDSCIDAVYDDGGGAFGLTDADVAAILREGWLLVDHLCDRIESGGDVYCKCTAHSGGGFAGFDGGLFD